MEELEGQLNLDNAPVWEIRLPPPYQGPWPPQPPDWGDGYIEWSHYLEYRYTHHLIVWPGDTVQLLVPVLKEAEA